MRNSSGNPSARIRGMILVFAAMLFCGRYAAPAASGNISAGFDAANKLYEEGKFHEAAVAYQKLTESGTVSPALFFNLGNALFKSGQTGRAIASYRRAERLAPRDPDLRANLQFVRNRIPGPSMQPSAWRRWLGTLTLNEWTVLASSLVWVCLLLLVLGQGRPAWKFTLRTVTLASGLAAVILCACLGAAFIARSAPGAIVVASEAAVHTGPLDESQTVFSVRDGAELAVLDHKDDWLQVTAGDRRIGWLKRDQVIVGPY